MITFLSSWPGGKQVSMRARNFCPMLVEMDWENGGLNQVTVLLLVLELALGAAGSSQIGLWLLEALSKASRRMLGGLEKLLMYCNLHSHFHFSKKKLGRKWYLVGAKVLFGGSKRYK